MCADFLHMRRHYNEFVEGLTPEEKEIHDKELEKGLMTEMVRQIKDKLKSEMRKGKKDISMDELNSMVDDAFRDMEQKTEDGKNDE